VWKLQLYEKTVKLVEAAARDAAKNGVVWLIDKALAPRKAKLKPRDDWWAACRLALTSDPPRSL
jgi:hypothetical protein